MDGKQPGSWEHSTQLARSILHDRKERRKWMAYMMAVPVVMLALGLWVLDGWIWSSPWRVLFWWGGCAVMTFIVMIFAVYDALAVVREEREKSKLDVDNF